MYSVNLPGKSLTLSPLSVFLLFPVSSAASPAWSPSPALLLAGGVGQGWESAVSNQKSNQRRDLMRPSLSSESIKAILPVISVLNLLSIVR